MPYSWTLEPDAVPSTTTPTPGAISRTPSPLDAFLGYGLVRPFRRDLKSDFASAGGEALVRSCVGQILGTRASSDYVQGELPWRPEFGSLLYLGKHRRGPLLDELVRAWAVDALRRWEPRVQITAVTASFDPKARTLTVSLRYNVIDQNVPGNNVLLPNVEQVLELPVAA